MTHANTSDWSVMEMAKRKRPSTEAMRLLKQLKTQDALIDNAYHRYRQWLKIVHACRRHGFEGLTLMVKEKNRWAVIMQDAQTQGFRYALFDRKGFFGYGVYQTPQDAVQAAFDMGYRLIERRDRLNDIALSCWFVN